MASYSDYQEISDGYAVATFDRVFMASCRKTLSIEDLHGAHAALERHRTKIKAQVAALSFTLASIGMPDSQTRALAAEMMGQTRGRVLAAATIIEGSGFAASATRAAAAGVYLLSRSPIPYKIVATPDDVAQWFSTLLMWTATQGSDFVQAAHSFRQRHLSARDA